MLREVYCSVFLIAAISLSGAGCIAGDDDTPGEPDIATPGVPPANDVVIASTSVPVPLKPAPIRPPAPSGTGTDGTLPSKPASGSPQPFGPTAAWFVGLTSSPSFLWPTQFSTLTATANMDVGPTPYFIRIRSRGVVPAIVMSCGFGTTCSASVTQSTILNMTYSATIEDSAGTPVPLTDTFSENFTFVSWHGSGIALTASAPTTLVGNPVTLTATTLYDVGPSPFYVELFDDTTGTFLGACGGGTACSTTVSQTVATTHAYKACFSSFGTSFPPPNLLECTRVQYVTWSSMAATVSLTAPSSTLGSETVIATASFDVGPTPYFIQIYDLTSGSRITSCGAGTTCTTTFTPSTAGSSLIAFVAPASFTIPPPGAVAQSFIVDTIREVIR